MSKIFTKFCRLVKLMDINTVNPKPNINKIPYPTNFLEAFK